MVTSFLLRTMGGCHGLRTPREGIAFTARPKIQSQSQIFRYGWSIFCLPHRPNFSDIFYLCLHWVSVVRGWVPSQLWNGGDFSQAFFDIILGPTTLSFWILFRLGFFPAFHGQNSLLIYYRKYSFTADVFSSLDLIHLFPKFPAFWFLKKNRHVTQKSSHAKIALVEL